MSKIQAIQANTFSETPARPGIARHLAFKDEGSGLLRSQTEPESISGWHHREINPSPSEGNDVILFLHGTGPLVVNVDDPEQA
jgi:hypothetical protein